MATLAYYADAKIWTGKVGTAMVPRWHSIRGHNWFLRCPGVLSERFGIHMFSHPSLHRVTVLGHNLVIKEIEPTHRAIPNYPGSWSNTVRSEMTVLPIIDDHLAAAIASFTAKSIVDGRIDLAGSLETRPRLLGEEPRPWIAAITALSFGDMFT